MLVQQISWKIYDIFQVKKEITKKGYEVEDTQLLLNTSNNNGKYKVKEIQDSEVYAKELENGYLLSFYYLIA